ncbi:hypothetical protein J6590_057274 [Homalodisca vitripennis]|nr:hypothetical protein J6590_057274 [Homalodisca vitripennis]
MHILVRQLPRGSFCSQVLRRRVRGYRQLSDIVCVHRSAAADNRSPSFLSVLQDRFSALFRYFINS